jgi:hypothetical protein
MKIELNNGKLAKTNGKEAVVFYMMTVLMHIVGADVCPGVYFLKSLSEKTETLRIVKVK